jgi:type III pantothenate kinase
MLLAIDIGNTNIVVGLFDRQTLQSSSRYRTEPRQTSDECRQLMQAVLHDSDTQVKQVSQIVVASVVPSLSRPFHDSVKRLFAQEALFVSHTINLPVTIDVDRPEEVGADRIANAVAGSTLFGAPLIVVDLGTATTFDVVNHTGAYVGGVITAGPETAMEELSRKAAQLYKVQLKKPLSIIGRNTTAAMQSGMYYGTVGQIDFIVDRIIREGKFNDCTVIATGGLASGLEEESRFIQRVAPNLTLDGLRIIAEMNR